MDKEESERRVLGVLSEPGGDRKISRVIEQVLWNNVPSFVLTVKGKEEVYLECLGASIVIVQEELQKGKQGLYDRLRSRVDNYWKEENKDVIEQ